MPKKSRRPSIRSSLELLPALVLGERHSLTAAWTQRYGQMPTVRVSDQTGIFLMGSIRIHPRKSSHRLPKWIWEHDAAKYAHDHYHACVDTIRQGPWLEDDERIPPNYPKGYKFEPWNDIMKDVVDGEDVDLGPGEWF